jgi:hypothetical protein
MACRAGPDRRLGAARAGSSLVSRISWSVDPAGHGLKGCITVLTLPFLVAVLATVGVFGVVGGALTWAVGLRGFWLIAAAPAFALTIIGGSAAVAPWVGLPWSLIPVLAIALVVAAVIYAVRRRVGGVHDDPQPWRRELWPLVGVLVAAVVLVVQVTSVVGAPEHISQTFDNVFHLNAVRYILETGNASSLHLGSMTSPDGSLPFYPAGWHAVVSLIVQLTGVTIPVAVNAVVLVVACVVWPLSAMLLTRTLFGGSLPVALGTVIVATSVPAFPLLLMDYGVLYPLQLGLAVLPVALAATLRILGLTPAGSRRTGWWMLVLVGIVPGMAIAHPGAFVALLAVSAPMVLLFAWRRLRAAHTLRRRALVIVAVLVYAAVGVLLVKVLRPPADARGWPLQMRALDALWEVVSASMWYALPAVVAAFAILAGVIWSLIDRKAAPLLATAMWAVGAFLFLTVSSMPWPQLRDALTGSWYNNFPRLAAILAITMVPIGAYGVARTWTAVTAMMTTAGVRVAGPARRLSAGVVSVALVALAVVPQSAQLTTSVSAMYRMDASSALLTADEFALLERLPQEVPPGVAVAGSAWTGASLAYAIADRPVLMPHTLMQVTGDLALINDGLEGARPGSAVCRAIADRNVGYVLDFGAQEVHPGRHVYPGLDALATSDAVRLVDSQGDARLYQVTGCS